MKNKKNIYAYISLIALFAFAMIVIFGMGSVYACSCIAPGSVSDEFRTHDVVFLGKVMDIDNVTNNDFGQSDLLVTFYVEKSFKGNAEDNIQIKTSGSSASCGYTFEENKKSYVVYARDWDGKGELSVSLCSRTALADDATEDLDFLNTLNPDNQYGSVFPIKITEDTDTGVDYTITEAYLENNLVVLGVSYGGCDYHNFELRASSSFSKSLPPQREIYLYHDAKDDTNECEIVFNEKIAFDLDKLSEPYDKNEVILNLHSSDEEIIKLTNTLIVDGEEPNNPPTAEPQYSFWQKIKNWFRNIFMIIDSIKLV